MGCVYMFGEGEERFAQDGFTIVKVGRSSDNHLSRLAPAKTWNPRIQAWYVAELPAGACDKAAEFAAHNSLEGLRENGEWFRWDQAAFADTLDLLQEEHGATIKHHTSAGNTVWQEPTETLERRRRKSTMDEVLIALGHAKLTADQLTTLHHALSSPDRHVLLNELEAKHHRLKQRNRALAAA